MKKAKKTSTAYGVFIIESLRDGDFRDGETLDKILGMARINSFYKWVRSKSEFTDAIKDFDKSGYRYLHISCHSDKDGLEIGGQEIPNSDLVAIFNKNVSGRRVFLSSCNGSNLITASIVIEKCKGQSVIGTPTDIYSHEATLFWPSFYYVINRIDKEKMNQKSISNSLQRCVDLFGIQINYYYKSKRKGYINRYKIISKGRSTKKLVKAAFSL